MLGNRLVEQAQADKLGQLRDHPTKLAFQMLREFVELRTQYQQLEQTGAPEGIVKEAWDKELARLSQTYLSHMQLAGCEILTKTTKGGEPAEDTKITFGNVTDKNAVRSFDLREFVTLTSNK